MIRCYCRMKKYLKETVKYCLRSYPFIRKYINEIDKLYEISTEDLKQRNERVFLNIFHRAYDSSPFYHNLYIEEGINKDAIKSLADITKLPIITKDMVKAHGVEMLTVPSWKLIKNHTSGTTGTPLTVYEDWPSIWKEQAYLYCYRKRCGFTYGQPLVSLRGNLEKSDIYLKVHISNTLFLSSYNLNNSTILTYYNQIVKHKPIAIEGYPSSLYALALLLRDNNMQLHIPLTFTSSETLLDYQRELIQSQMDTVIYDLYGTTERTIQLCEALNHNGYYEAPGYSINEYIENGEITTSLINSSFPLIRYQSNDIMELEELSENNAQVRVKSIQGRNEDYIVCKDGSKVMRLDFIFKKAHNIKCAQLIQKQLGEILIKIVPDDHYSIDDSKIVVSELEDRVGKGNLSILIEIVTMDGLIYSKRGKFKYIVNQAI